MAHPFLALLVQAALASTNLSFQGTARVEWVKGSQAQIVLETPPPRPCREAPPATIALGTHLAHALKAGDRMTVSGACVGGLTPRGESVSVAALKPEPVWDRAWIACQHDSECEMWSDECGEVAHRKDARDRVRVYRAILRDKRQTCRRPDPEHRSRCYLLKCELWHGD
jgi:hypothetical protein